MDLPSQARLVHRGRLDKPSPGEPLRYTARGISVAESKVPWRGLRVTMEV